MAQLNDLVVTGKSRFLNDINANVTGTASNVTGTVAIGNGGTGATTRLSAAQNLTNEAVTNPGYVVGLTQNWGKFGYTTIDQLKTTIGSASAASGGTAITMCTTGEKYTWNNSANTVTQTASLTASTEYGVLLTSSASDSSNHTEGSRKSQLLTYSEVPGRDNSVNGTLKVLTTGGGGDPWGIKISEADIEIINSSASAMSWDGTNTSLSTSLKDKLSKTGGTMTGNLTVGVNGSSYPKSYVQLEYSTSAPSIGITYQSSSSSVNSSRLDKTGVSVSQNSSSLNIGYNDITFSASSNPPTWDGTNTSLKTAVTNAKTKYKDQTVTIPSSQTAYNGYYYQDYNLSSLGIAADKILSVSIVVSTYNYPAFVQLAENKTRVRVYCPVADSRGRDITFRVAYLA